MAGATYLHGTAVLYQQRGLLLLGESGAGKSDLALRLMHQGGQLIGDDQLQLKKIGQQLVVAGVPALAGKIEARGIGILAVPFIAAHRLDAVIELVPSYAERVPMAACWRYADDVLPLLRLCPTAPSAVAVLSYWLAQPTLFGAEHAA